MLNWNVAIVWIVSLTIAFGVFKLVRFVIKLAEKEDEMVQEYEKIRNGILETTCCEDHFHRLHNRLLLHNYFLPIELCLDRK